MFPFHLDLTFIGLKIIPQFESIYFLISILAGFLIGRKRLLNAGLEQNWEELSSFAYTCLLFAVIGTRLSHFLFWSFDIFIKNPLIVITPGVSGASIVGGLMAGFTAAYFLARKKKYDFYKIFAAVSPAVLIAQSVGRVGCFLNGDAYGVYTSLPWGVRFPRYGYTFPTFKKSSIDCIAYVESYYRGWPGITETRSSPLHPTQLYEILGNMVLLGLILLVIKRFKNGKGSLKYVFFIHCGGYSLFRFLLQFLRTDKSQVIFGDIGILQIVLFAIFCYFLAAGIVLFVKSRDANTIQTKV